MRRPGKFHKVKIDSNLYGKTPDLGLTFADGKALGLQVTAVGPKAPAGICKGDYVTAADGKRLSFVESEVLDSTELLKEATDRLKGATEITVFAPPFKVRCCVFPALWCAPAA